ncbi:MAG: Crp/Fnr family transcriptional regulator [Bacteroidota bacterium]
MYLRKIKIKKGQIIQTKGEFNTKIYHVLSGLLRSYSIDEKGKEHIFLFAPEGWTVADSITPDKPCDLFIDAIEDSVVVISEKDPAAEATDIKKLRKRIWVMQTRIVMLMSATAIERYEHFIDTYPDIVQRVPQRMIASYLGITPEALSKVKRDRVRKGVK